MRSDFSLLKQYHPHFRGECARSKSAKKTAFSRILALLDYLITILLYYVLFEKKGLFSCTTRSRPENCLLENITISRKKHFYFLCPTKSRSFHTLHFFVF